MAVLLRSMNHLHQRGMSLATMIEGDNNHNNNRDNVNHGQLYFQQGPSLS